MFSGCRFGGILFYFEKELYQRQKAKSFLDKTFVFCYDDIGNISSIATYNYTTGELGSAISTQAFTYNADKLTAFGNKAITYNANGEMASFDGWDYSWSKGKLSRMEKTIGGSSTWAIKPNLPSNPSFPDSKAYTFTYNAVGQRVGMQYTYTQGSSSLSAMQVGELLSHSKTFTYDHAGRLMAESNSKTLYDIGTDNFYITYLYDGNTMIGMQYATATQSQRYYYHRNMQGDVVGIYDTDGNMKVRYAYDAWGNCTIVTDDTTDMNLAKNNPIRYRGYYYDQNTGLYYLNARYYSPELRRFISPDDTAYLDSENVDGLNLYAYCNNDPVNRIDPSGHAWYSTVWDWINTIVGFLNPFSTLTALGALAYAAFTGGWNDVKQDWKNGCLNPFNQDIDKVSKANILAFYKGSTAIVQNILPDSGFTILGTMFLGVNSKASHGHVKHEYGHTVQERILGPIAYLLNIAIPSVTYYWYDTAYNASMSDDERDLHYFSMPWERTAEWLGHASNPRLGYKSGSLPWGIVENLLGPIVIPFYFLFGY